MRYLLIFLFYAPWAGASDLSALTQQLKSLVEQESGSDNAKGVERVQSWVANELKALGFAVDINKNNFLVATLAGEDPRTLTFITHADTVFGASSKFKGFRLVEGKGATGPGVIDDKGGIVVALEGLRRYLAAHPKPSHTLRFLCSPSEELGSPGLKETFKSLSQDSWLVLGFEPSLEDGSIVTTRRGNRWYHVTVAGRETHSGRAFADGINACRELALKVAKISEFTDLKRDVTVSIGHMAGGKDKYNIMCGDAEAKIDTRFATVADRDRLHAQIEKALAKTYVAGAKTTFELADDSPPVSPAKGAAKLISQYTAAVSEVEGRPIHAGKSGGAGDTNAFSREGLVIIDGLGPTGGKMHTEDEFISLPSLESRAEALSRFLSRLEISK